MGKAVLSNMVSRKLASMHDASQRYRATTLGNIFNQTLLWCSSTACITSGLFCSFQSDISTQFLDRLVPHAALQFQDTGSLRSMNACHDC